MGSIDERIVSMKFDNKQFEAGVSQTMASLSKLSASLAQVGSVTGFADIDKAAAKVTLDAPMSALDKLKARLGMVGSNAGDGFSDIEKAGSKLSLLSPFSILDKLKARLGGIGDGAAEGFADVEKASGQVDFQGLTSQIDSLGNNFSILAGAAAVAFGNIATKAAASGAAFAKSFSFGPIMQGFEEYQTNLNSIQTILANTKASGADLDDVNAALQKLNTYSDQTIYNFSEMAKNIGTFTAAGVDLDTATQSIKGIANLAAVSGSNSQQASTAMYQLSQAISSGRVSLQDWNSVVNAGMGGGVFQKALANTAVQMGSLSEGAVEFTGKMDNAKINGQSFRESIMAKPGEQSWLTKEVLTGTLEQFTGDLTDAELAAQGFTAAQVKDIQMMAKTAKEAATQIKTFPQLMDVIKEAIGSGWALTFQTIFGDFDEARKTFTELGTYIADFIGKNAEARNKILADWKMLGGRTDLIEGIKNVWKGLLTVIKPISEAFRDIFPKKTGLELRNLTRDFRDFTEKLKVGPEKAELLKRSFKGVFALFHIGVTIIGEIVKMFGKLLGATGEGSGGILNFTGSMGDFLVAVDKALTDGGLLTNFFKILTAALKAPIQVLGALTEGIFGLFTGVDGKKLDKFNKSIGGLSLNLKPAEKALNRLKEAWKGFLKFLEPVADKMKTAFAAIGDGIANAFSPENYDRTLEAIKTGFIGGIFLSIKKALGDGINVEVGGLKGLSNMFKVLTGNLMAMQQNLQAETLLKLGAAIGLLAVGVLVLSKIDAKALAKGLLAVSIGLVQLVGALALLGKASGGSKAAFITLPIMATGLVALAAAVVLLAGAVAIFSTLSWESLAKGLLGVAGALIAVDQGTKYLSGPHLIGVGLALIPLAIGLNLIALAVRQLGTLSFVELGTGIAGMALALVAIGKAIVFIPPEGLIRLGIGLTALGFALTLIAGAVLAFGSMDLITMGKGLLGIGVSLVILGKALMFIPPNLAVQAAGLVLVSVALTGLAGAVGLMGKLDILTIAKGIAALGAMLVVLGRGLMGMTKTLPGSQALLAAAIALSILAPVLGFLGQLEILTIVKGLAAMAAVLGVLALAGTFATLPIKLLGFALAPLALVMAATAASAYLFAKALVLMGTEGAKGVGVLIAAMGAFMLALPTMIINFMKGLVQILAELAKVAPKIVESLATIIISMVDVFVKAAPALALAIGTLIGIFLKVVIAEGPQVIKAGFLLLVTFLKGLADNIGKVTTLAIKVVLEFLKALTKDIGRLVAAGAKFLVAFLGGVAKNIGKVANAAGDVIAKFLKGIAAQIGKIIDAGIDVLLAFIGGVIKGFGKIISTGVKMIGQLIKGIGEAVPDLIKKAVEVIGKVIKAMAKSLVRFAELGAEAVIDFMNGMADVIRDKAPQLRRAGGRLAGAIISGMTFGLSDKAPALFNKVREIISKIPAGVRKLLGIRSPSAVMAEIGRQTMMGLTHGVIDGGSGTERAMETSGNQVVKMAKRTMGNMAGILDGVMDLDPVIAPVLDLSAVHKEAGKLKYISDIKPIVPAASFDQASAISQEKIASDTQAAEAAQAGPTFQFEQNNYSPESLSDVEIYRKTHNQLSQVKSAIGLVS